MRNQMMSAVWLLNTLENSLHEPNCLIKQIIDGNALESLTSTDLNEEEQGFAYKELKKFQKRLGMTIKLLEELEVSTNKALENNDLNSPVTKYVEELTAADIDKAI